MDYTSQAARDAQTANYGGPSYWQSLDDAADRHRDYFLRHGDQARADTMHTRSLSEALTGNNGD